MKIKILALILVLVLASYPIYNFYTLQTTLNFPEEVELEGLGVLTEIGDFSFVQAEENIDAIADLKYEIYLEEQEKLAEKLAAEEAENARLTALNKVLDSIKNEDTTYRAVLKDVFVVGDSLMQGLNNYEILNEDNMITQVSANLYHLEENIDAIIEQEPTILLLHYGLNHLSEEEVQCTRFINLYTSLLEPLIEALDDTQIIVSSIFPVDLELNEEEKFEYIEYYNDAMQEMCDELGIEFLRSDTDLFTQDVYDSDGIHMKKTFYTEVWLDFLIEELEMY
ncbi:MAG: hypothetical protein R3Y27_02605 [Clostridia bacterium]